MAEKKAIRTQLTGSIVSISGKNTIKVKVESKYPHPIYEKIRTHHKSFLADVDLEKNELNVGDVVTIEATRPISKRKTWKFVAKVK